MLDAIRVGARTNFQFEDWSRIVDYAYSLTPLSMEGSLRDIGGRFNIGRDISPATSTPFPALYIAETYEAALKEKFLARSSGRGQSALSADELALRKPGSFSQLRLRGRVDLIFDVGSKEALKPFVEVIKQFDAPKSAGQMARRLAINRPWLIRSAGTLQQQLLHPKWRATPMQFGLPANSQIFARIAAAAGLHGILYPSARDDARQCLALFPQNWRANGSFIEIVDAVPAGVVKRLDGTD